MGGCKILPLKYKPILLLKCFRFDIQYKNIRMALRILKVPRFTSSYPKKFRPVGYQFGRIEGGRDIFQTFYFGPKGSFDIKGFQFERRRLIHHSAIDIDHIIIKGYAIILSGQRSNPFGIY